MKNIKQIKLYLSKPGSAKFLNDFLKQAETEGYKEIKINVVTNDNDAYSNRCVPLAGIIDYYKTQGMKIFLNFNYGNYAKHIRIFEPLDVCDQKANLNHPFDVIWSFTTEDSVRTLVNAFTKAIRQETSIETGVVQTLEWCLNETLDNVLIHSEEKKGFIMAQNLKDKKRFNFCVFDYGIGIYNSFKDTKYRPKNPLVALVLSTKEKTTSNDERYQGNGLWGLSQLIKETGGSFTISSGGAEYGFRNGQEHKKQIGAFLFNSSRGTTKIDAQIDYSKPIDFCKIIGEDRPDIWLENHENNNGQFVLNIKSDSNGTGTRPAGEQIRHIVENAFRAGYPTILFDFEDIESISSSYADELFGQLLVSMGFFEFVKRITIIRLNEFCQAVLNRSVGLRMAHRYLNEPIPKDD